MYRRRPGESRSCAGWGLGEGRPAWPGGASLDRGAWRSGPRAARGWPAAALLAVVSQRPADDLVGPALRPKRSPRGQPALPRRICPGRPAIRRVIHLGARPVRPPPVEGSNRRLASVAISIKCSPSLMKKRERHLHVRCRDGNHGPPRRGSWGVIHALSPRTPRRPPPGESVTSSLDPPAPSRRPRAGPSPAGWRSRAPHPGGPAPARRGGTAR
jgi:hypothetical protein